MRTEQLVTFLISPEQTIVEAMQITPEGHFYPAEDRCECEGDSFYYQYR